MEQQFTHQQLQDGECTADQFWGQFIEPRNYEDVLRVTGGLDNLLRKGIDGLDDNTWYFLAIYPNSMHKLYHLGGSFSYEAAIKVNKLAAKHLIEQNSEKIVAC